jgi:pseudouridine-5'-monophosphatase
MMITAVLFDFDGLLVDSEPLQEAAWHRFVARYDRVLEPDLMRRMFGLRLLESAALVREELGLPLSVEQVMEERDAEFLASLPGALRAMPEAGATVAAMSELRLRTALATSGHQRYITIALRELGLTNAFDAIVTGDMVARGKPAPDIFLRAAELLGVPPAECVVVEDAPHGIAAARAAGMFAVAVPNHLTQDLDFTAAHMMCPSLGVFRAWMEQQQRQVGR